ncbi:hypothetical protein PR202_ga23371 [Eleusine coracana subsp. coracana]|uniref:Uncharacterized protein n=1 Tax=Eleusine coracana subsp. coracana TaxID=191504 RepID=A0AAV5D621_ELECO|nr:hypothetical protein PR202_ga23371 [Eleusine coracana subsp. coracana]
MHMMRPRRRCMVPRHVSTFRIVLLMQTQVARQRFHCWRLTYHQLPNSPMTRMRWSLWTLRCMR